MADAATDTATKTPPPGAKEGAKKSEKGITGFVKEHKAVAITVGIVLLVLIYYFFIKGSGSASSAQNAAAAQQAQQTAADNGASGLSDQQLSDLESAISGSVGLQGPSGTQGGAGPTGATGPAGAGAIGHWITVGKGKYGKEWVAPTKTYAGYYAKQGKKEVWHPASNTAPKK